MAERKYSIPEIDEMRKHVRRMFPFNHDRTVKDVEERLRTYMLNGTEPAELKEAADEYVRQDDLNFRIYLAHQSGDFEAARKLQSERTGA